MNNEISEKDAKAAAAYLTNLAQGICPQCQQKVETQKQVGRCVYAEPCGHYLFQGKAKVQKKTWEDHPYFHEGS